eukprot:9059504-Pyramimonas_sp.AAC.1
MFYLDLILAVGEHLVDVDVLQAWQHAALMLPVPLQLLNNRSRVLKLTLPQCGRGVVPLPVYHSPPQTRVNKTLSIITNMFNRNKQTRVNKTLSIITNMFNRNKPEDGILLRA